MKKNLNLFVLAIVLMLAQACGPKTEKNEEPIATETPDVKEVTALTVAEKRAKLEREKSERLELRRIEFEKQAKLTPTFTDAEGKVVFIISEVAPSFNGGDKAMMEYLRDNIEFPKEAEEKGIEGTVFVDFIVAESGSVRQVEVTDATSDDVDQSFRTEAIRVVSSMPKWVPGRQHGKPVDVKFSIPITFQMR